MSKDTLSQDNASKERPRLPVDMSKEATPEKAHKKKVKTHGSPRNNKDAPFNMNKPAATK